MADHLSLETILSSIDEIDPSDPRIKCIGVTKGGYQCSRSILLKSDTLGAFLERSGALYRADAPSAPNRIRITFDKLVEPCCCWQHKIKFHANTDLGKEMRSQWQKDTDRSTTRNSTPEDSGTSSSLTDNTPDRGSTEAAHSITIFRRHNLRSVPQDSDSLAEDSRGAQAEEFVPMAKPGQTLRQKLLKGPVGKEMKDEADLYAFARASDPDKLKIGYSKSATTRLDAWRRSCKYQPILKHHIENVPCAKFVEGLIQYELLQYWRREVRCRHNAACLVQHQEWFHIDEATAFQVMDSWVEWIKFAEPYDQFYQLKPEWRAIIETMEDAGIQVTSQGLLDGMESLQVDDTIPNCDAATAAAAGMSVGKTPQPVFDKTVSEQIIDLRDATKVLSAIADLMVLLSPTQTMQLRELVDQNIHRYSLVALPPATTLVPAA